MHRRVYLHWGFIRVLVGDLLVHLEQVTIFLLDPFLTKAVREIDELRKEFHRDVYVPGSANELNTELEKALRVDDFMELGQLMAMDALQRKESAGGHFREEYQDAEGETLRDDVNFNFVGAWEYRGEDINNETLHKEVLNYEYIKIAARNYKS